MINHSSFGVEDSSYEYVVLIVRSNVETNLVASRLLEELFAVGLVLGDHRVNDAACVFYFFRVEFEVLGIELINVSALSDHLVNLLLISRGFFFLVGVNLLLFLFLFTSGSGSCFSELRFFHLLTFGGSELSGFHVRNILE